MTARFELFAAAVFDSALAVGAVQRPEMRGTAAFVRCCSL